MFCGRCRKKTESENVETIMTKNKRYRKKATCKVCGVKKSTFVKNPNLFQS